MAGHGERSAMFTARLNAKVLSLPEDSTADTPAIPDTSRRCLSCLRGAENSAASDGFEP
jgi:hypothetical protein